MLVACVAGGCRRFAELMFFRTGDFSLGQRGLIYGIPQRVPRPDTLPGIRRKPCYIAHLKQANPPPPKAPARNRCPSRSQSSANFAACGKSGGRALLGLGFYGLGLQVQGFTAQGLRVCACSRFGWLCRALAILPAAVAVAVP